MEALIQTTSLRCLDRLDYPPLFILEGGATFITGESGSGKSTLFRLLNGTLSPQEGTIFYQGQDIKTRDTIALRRDLLLASQEVFLFDGSIAENFAEYYRYREAMCPSQEAMQGYLSLTCADFPLDSRCETLSGGERQRVFLAICLSFEPSVLLLDEPTAALDDETASRFFRKVKAFAAEKGMTLLVICHNQGLVAQYADRCIRLEGRAM